MKKSSEKGQAIVEYIMMLALAISIVTALSMAFKKSIKKLWVALDQEIAAPCPPSQGCKAPVNIHP